MDSKESSFQDAILEEARKLFQKYGYNKIVMEDIAQAVKKGRSTLYIYFKNKEEIFNVILQKEADSHMEMMRKELANHHSAQDQIKAYCNVKFSFIHSKINEYLILSQEILQHANLLRKVRGICDTQEIDLLQNIIELGIQNKEFAPLPNGNAQMLASVLSSAMHGIVDDFCLQNPSCDIEPVKEIVELILLKTLNKTSSHEITE
ncbi:TetR/AcrR family transcriptional regulator [Mucilaginibacter sp. Bleaf8]|uniref:TetR/AcrR family transcriptional regulator n=1 Tax=Mucilaginibacter sp. Bleaf8 TaxID=2834430 RepID=UPI001BCB39D6|nr:TetR/AcrR family transcriptional regulator [Mucilaginibacter sp. Bleaf8]MBS7564854.1 TetR/AcrR family transcriptional regulator [Mucilaginibacter sp. Bleaf8]